MSLHLLPSSPPPPGSKLWGRGGTLYTRLLRTMNCFLPASVCQSLISDCEKRTGVFIISPGWNNKLVIFSEMHEFIHLTDVPKPFSLSKYHKKRVQIHIWEQLARLGSFSEDTLLHREPSGSPESPQTNLETVVSLEKIKSRLAGKIWEKRAGNFLPKLLGGSVFGEKMFLIIKNEIHGFKGVVTVKIYLSTRQKSLFVIYFQNDYPCSLSVLFL